MLNSVLIATDGSDNATRAVQLGSEIAHCFGAGVLIAHVQVEEPTERELSAMANLWQDVGPRPLGGFHMDDLFQRVASMPGREHVDTHAKALREIADRVLEQAQETAREAGVEAAETRLLHGEPAEAIIDLVGSQGPDLVVMGSRGMGRIEGALLGSVSQKVSAHTAASCLTVR